MTNETNEAIAAIRALIAWYEAAPDAFLDVAGDGMSDHVSEAIELIVAQNSELSEAVAAIQADDERAPDDELYGSDTTSAAFWDRVADELSYGHAD